MLDGSATVTARLSAELVAYCERPEPRQAPEPGLAYFSDDDYLAAARRLLGETGDGPFWVFAYGSLLWRPAFAVEATVHAQVEGWRREFCMEIRRWRGSPEQPGLMMGLRRGGHCSGLALQIAHEDREAQLVRLLKREVDCEEDLRSVRWVTAETDLGPVQALACWAEPIMSRMFVEKPLEEQACMIARACGSGGSGAAYLHRTMMSLADLGLDDDYLMKLDALVAQEIIMMMSRT
jgi:cation transport protein ChaC